MPPAAAIVQPEYADPCFPPGHDVVVILKAPPVVTVTLHEFEVILDPSMERAVIDTVPPLIPLTTPELLTVAVVVSFEFQVNVLFVAFEGWTVAVRVVVEPAATEAVDGMLMPATRTGEAALTVKLCDTGLAAA